MKFLFNSDGVHIANDVNGQLTSPSGHNIGHYLNDREIYIDMRGRYLGEIVAENRLMKNKNSPYANVNFGVYGDYGNYGNYGNPGRYGQIGRISGFEDIKTPWLQ